MPETLYLTQDIARIFGVGPSAVSNWRKRGSGPSIPDPLYRTPNGVPLWTADQLRAIVADHAAMAETLLGRESCEQ